MRTYRDLLRAPEFPPLFVTATLQVAGTTVSSLAMGTLVYAATHSPLLSALALFGSSFGQVIGAATLLSASDRLPPRAAMTAVAVAFGVGTAILAVPGLPLWAFFTVIGVMGVVASVGGGVRYGMLSEILPADGYLLGRSVLNISVGTSQICGFAVGGVLVTVLSPRGTLLTGAALNLVTAVVALAGLKSRPPRATGRPSIVETWRGNAALWSSPARRYVYVALCVPNGLIVGCESLFVAYSPAHAGLLFAFGAAGMLIGDVLGGRFIPPNWRERLGAFMRFLLAAPYLIFVLRPDLPIAAAAIMLASIGYCATLMLQERLMALTPENLHGQALGLHSSAMLAMQGVGAALAGAIAQHVSVTTTMTLMAVASVAATVAVSPGLKTGHIDAHDPSTPEFARHRPDETMEDESAAA
jgi:predicted MFS family arabinose efflux permease